MRFFKLFEDLKIRHKLLLGYSAVFILFSLLASTTIYHFVRRTIEANIESELQNSTTAILHMVHNAANVSIKNYLRALAEKNRDIVEAYYEQYQRGELSSEQAKAMARQVLLSQTIGKTGYIYCLNSDGIMDSHPHAALLGTDLSGHEFIRRQKLHKVGYLEYDWKNPSETHPRAKALYMTYFEPWDWIISVSSYRNEFKELINVDDFRDTVMSLKFGKTGYSYVIDTKGKLILHPKLEGINILSETDAEGRQFVKQMIAMGTGKITYSWKNAGESRRRDKLVIFNYLPEYDWIVASSSYLDEFYAPLETIEKIFVLTVFLSLLLVLPLTFWISSSITNPLGELMRRLSRGAKGDGAVRMDRNSRDEIGTLARYFNSFMERLELSRRDLQAEIEVRKQAEGAIRQSEAKYRELVENANSIILRVDTGGRVTFFNEFAQSFFGFKEEDILGRSSMGTITPRDSAGQPDAGPAMGPVAGSTGDHTYHEMENMRRDGQRVRVAWTHKAVRNDAGEVVEYLCIGHDITARTRMETVMVQTEKMMSVGGLAAGMAHEINNPLGAMVQNAQNILRRLSPELPANLEAAGACGVDLKAVRCYLQERQILTFLEGIRTSGQNAADIVENMLHFSRNSESRKAPVLLDELLDKTVALAAHDYDLKKKYDFRRIRIERQFERGMGRVPCVATEIEQVLLNLLRNAAQAMAGHNEEGPPPHIILRLFAGDGTAMIEVEDNGPGLDAQQIKRVFEPFYTTKDVGVGTGLGLSVSYFIVTNNHGGTIEVNPAPGGGAKFSISLPMADDGAMQETAALKHRLKANV
jgi:PAS domain S-box-containing protein